MSEPLAIVAVRFPQDLIDHVIDKTTGCLGGAHTEIIYRGGHKRCTATLADGFTQKPRPEGYAPGPCQWLFYDISSKLTEELIEAAEDWADSEEGAGYDTLGLFRCWTRIMPASQGKWWCSEASKKWLRVAKVVETGAADICTPNQNKRELAGFPTSIVYPYAYPLWNPVLANHLKWPI